MTEAKELFHQIAAEIPETKEGKMFGALCIKAPNGKSGVMFKNNHIVFKLDELLLQETLSLDGAQLFDPSGGRPMKGWVQLPYSYAAQWPELALQAMEFVKNLK